MDVEPKFDGALEDSFCLVGVGVGLDMDQSGSGCAESFGEVSVSIVRRRDISHRCDLKFCKFCFVSFLHSGHDWVWCNSPKQNKHLLCPSVRGIFF